MYVHLMVKASMKTVSDGSERGSVEGETSRAQEGKEVCSGKDSGFGVAEGD